MVWRYGREGATHKIWSESMQRFLRNLSLRTTDGRRTTDACAMTVALLTKSSRAKKSSVIVFFKFGKQSNSLYSILNTIISIKLGFDFG